NNVVADRACKEKWLLQNKADFLRSLFRGIRSDVFAVERNAATNWIVESRQQRSRRCFAPAGGSHQRICLTTCQRETGVREHVLPATVAETNVLECKHRAGSCHRIWHNRHIGFERQNLRNSIQSGEGELERRPQRRNLPEWHVEAVDVKEKPDQQTDTDLA